MDKETLKSHIDSFLQKIEKGPLKFQQEKKEREENISFFQTYTPEKIRSMNEDDVYSFISKLWAMLIWGNKHYVVDKLISENGLENFKDDLIKLVWSEKTIEERWNDFRKNIKGLGPAMTSEILCKIHPERYMLWNRRAYVGLKKLKIKDLPRYDYQLTGKRYSYLCDKIKEIALEFGKVGITDANLLAVDYFIWHEVANRCSFRSNFCIPGTR